MPLRKAPKGASKATRRKVASKAIREFSHGKSFAHTKRKFGAARAQAQAIAVGLKTAGLSRRRKTSSRKKR
jgi:hypothetical protein